MKILSNKQFWFGTILILLLSLIPLLWFHGNQILIGHDNVFPLNFKEFLRDRLFTWSEHHGLGYDQSSGMGSIILHTIDAFPSFFGFSVQTTQKIVYCFYFFAMMFSSFLFCLYLEKFEYIQSKYFKYFLPILYTFNFYTLEAWWIGERTKFELMIVLPLFLLIMLFVVKAKGSIFKYAIYASILLSIFNGGGWKGITLYGGLLIAIVTFIIYAIIFEIETTRKEIIKKISFFILSFMIVFTAVNAYSIFPFLSHTLSQYKNEISRIGGTDNLKGWIDVISHDTSYTNLFRFEGIPEWYTSLDHPYGQMYIHNQVLIAISYIFIVLILFSFLLPKNTKQKKLFFYFVFLFLTSLFFVSGSHPPLGFFYLVIVRYVPGFAIFRTPIYKFGYSFWFAGAFLISYTLSYIVDKGRNFVRKNFFIHKISGEVIVCFIISMLLLYHYPFLTGNIFSWSKNQLENRVTIPNYIFQTTEWFQSQNNDQRILFLPRANNNWKGDVYNWRFFSLYPLTADISRQPFLYNNDSLTSDETNLVNQLYDGILLKDTHSIMVLSDILRVKYLVVRDDYFYNLQWTKTEPPALYTQAIRQNKIFSYVKSFGKWDIYKITRDYEVAHVYPFTSVSIYNGAENFVNAASYISKTNSSQSFASSNAIVNMDSIGEYYNSLSIDNAIYFSNCDTCDVVSNSVSVDFPIITLLPTSPFYNFFENLRAIRTKKHFSDEELGFHDLGETLRYSEELELIEANFFNKNQETRNAAVDFELKKLTYYYDDINKWIDRYLITDQKRIQNYQHIDYYLTMEEKKINNFMLLDLKNIAGGNPMYVTSLHRMLTSLNSLTAKIHTFNDSINYINEKMYFPQVVPNKYSLSIQFPANITSDDLKSTVVSVDNKQLTPVQTDTTISNYGTAKINQNTKVDLEMAQNNFADTVAEDIQNKPVELQNTRCVGSIITNLRTSDNYRIALQYINDFSDNLKFVIYSQDKNLMNNSSNLLLVEDLYKTNESTDTRYYNFIPQFQMHAMFVGICSPQLTKQVFDSKASLQINRVISPELILTNPLQIRKSLGKVNFTMIKLNQTKYKVTFSNITAPFVFTFFEKYNTDWKLYLLPQSTDSLTATMIKDTIFEKDFFTTWFRRQVPETKHFLVDGYANGWVLDQKGNYSVIIEYRPQKLFYQGLIVTIVVISVLLVFILKKNNE